MNPFGGIDEPKLKIIFICMLRKKLANATSSKPYGPRGYLLREPHEEEVRIPA
jgi:two-component system cell cycle response regulator CtrA